MSWTHDPHTCDCGGSGWRPGIPDDERCPYHGAPTCSVCQHEPADTLHVLRNRDEVLICDDCDSKLSPTVRAQVLHRIPWQVATRRRHPRRRHDDFELTRLRRENLELLEAKLKLERAIARSRKATGDEE